MRLYLKNIGMLKEADVKLDGLTVIAGENDTGKSTVGKVLFIILKAKLFALNSKTQYKNKFNWLIKNIFENQSIVCNNSKIILENEIKIIYPNNFEYMNNKFLEAIFIETPFIFNLYKTFLGINTANSYAEALGFKIPFNYIWWDIFVKLSQTPKTKSNINLEEELNFIEKTINGKFKKYNDISNNKWVYLKDKEYEMPNIAMGIKQFGIIYALIKEGYLSKEKILIIDEPEVHLHPKWQIEYAKLIIRLVKKGIRVLITSHSPFFIEALEILSNDLHTNFYLAIKENNYSIIKEADLNEIYQLLSESIDTLEEMQIESQQW